MHTSAFMGFRPQHLTSAAPWLVFKLSSPMQTLEQQHRPHWANLILRNATQAYLL